MADALGVDESSSRNRSTAAVTCLEPNPLTSSEGSCDWELIGARPGTDVSVAEAEEVARALRVAAEAAESFAQRLPDALRRSAAAEAEVLHLRTALRASERKVEGLQAQQVRLTEGFVGEVRQRDLEIAELRGKLATLAAAAVSPSDGQVHDLDTQQQPSAAASLSPAREQPLAAASSSPSRVELLTFTEEGPLGIEFLSERSPFIVSLVQPQSLATGRVFAGDEIISVNGRSTADLPWEEMRYLLCSRPAVASIRRATADSTTPPSSQGERGRAGSGVVGRVKLFAGGLRNAVDRVASTTVEGIDVLDRTLDRVLDQHTRAGEVDVQSSSGYAATGPALAPRPLVMGPPQEPAMDAMEDAEDRNKPFYDMIHASMADALAASTAEARADDEAVFGRWLRQFHNDRDDEWYGNNYTRVYNAFRPHWERILEVYRIGGAAPKGEDRQPSGARSC